MAKHINKMIIRAFLAVCFILPSVTAMAQCPMCKLSAENSDIKGGLNLGILYLLAAPFLLMGGAMAYWYFNRKEFGSE